MSPNGVTYVSGPDSTPQAVLDRAEFPRVPALLNEYVKQCHGMPHIMLIFTLQAGIYVQHPAGSDCL